MLITGSVIVAIEEKGEGNLHEHRLDIEAGNGSDNPISPWE
jgi:hypothetical protein